MLNSMHYSSILNDVVQQSDDLLQHFVQDLYQRLTAYLHWPFLLCIQLYIIFVGYGVLHGWFVVAWRNMSIVLYKLISSVALMTQWDLVNAYIIKPVVDGSSQLGAVILNASPGTLTSHQSMIDVSQRMLLQVVRLGMSLWHAGSWFHYSRLFAGVCVWGSGITVILYGFIQIMIAHMILYIMLALLPIFILLSLFRSSSALTWRWISICVSSIVLVLFMSTVMSLNVTLMQQVLSPYELKGGQIMKLIEVLPIVVVSALSCVVMKRIVSLSAYVSEGLLDYASTSWANGLGSKHVGGGHG